MVVVVSSQMGSWATLIAPAIVPRIAMLPKFHHTHDSMEKYWPTPQLDIRDDPRIVAAPWSMYSYDREPQRRLLFASTRHLATHLPNSIRRYVKRQIVSKELSQAKLWWNVVWEWFYLETRSRWNC